MVGIKELNDGVDIHEKNMNDFGMYERLHAKVFLFRWLYRGPAWSYANDIIFRVISKSVNFWQAMIDTANEKYSTLYKFQNQLIRDATNGRVISNPTGREYTYTAKEKDSGEKYFAIPDIINQGNQGFAGDLMSIFRVSLYRRLLPLVEFQEGRILPINTIHDDVQLDVDNNDKLLYTVCKMCEDAMKDIPTNYTRMYGEPFNVPISGEVQFGHHLSDLTEFNNKLGGQQFNVSSSSNNW